MLNPIYKLQFGKHQGYSLAEVYWFFPDYLEWCIVNITGFCLDLGAFKKLQDPLDISPGGLTNEAEMLIKLGSAIKLEIFYISITKWNLDSISRCYDILSQGFQFKTKEFTLSENAKELNSTKNIELFYDSRLDKTVDKIQPESSPAEDFLNHDVMNDVDWSRETFNVLTEGQYGSYDEFVEEDGDLDLDDLKNSLGH